MKLLNLINQRFGRLLVLCRSEIRTNQHKGAFWVCLCDCGNKTIVSCNDLRSGKTKSCGCFRNDVSRQRMTTHGMTHTREYNSWRGMIERCSNSNHQCFASYGGRGIRVCKRWYGFENFYKDMGDCPKGLSIERIDNDGHYEPANCKWGTGEEQANNKSSNRILEFNGEKMTMAQAAQRVGIIYTTLQRRLLLGWRVERALTEPVRALRK